MNTLPLNEKQLAVESDALDHHDIERNKFAKRYTLESVDSLMKRLE